METIQIIRLIMIFGNIITCQNQAQRFYSKIDFFLTFSDNCFLHGFAPFLPAARQFAISAAPIINADSQ